MTPCEFVTKGKKGVWSGGWAWLRYHLRSTARYPARRSDLPRRFACAERRVFEGRTDPVGVENAVFRTLYTLAVAALVDAFVGFGLEVFYSTPGFYEGPFADGPGGPPPEVEDTAPAELPPDAMEEPPPKGPPDFEPGLPPEISAYERELAEHNRVASPVAIGRRF